MLIRDPSVFVLRSAIVKYQSIPIPAYLPYGIKLPYLWLFISGSKKAKIDKFLVEKSNFLGIF